MWKKKFKLRSVLLALVLCLAGCGGSSGGSTQTASSYVEADYVSQRDTDISAQLNYEGSMELSYAEEFAVDYYEGGYVLLTVADKSRYLVVPENQPVPDDLDGEVIVLQRPLEKIYLVASATMDMFRSLNAIECIRFSGLTADSWYIPQAQEAMENGDILYAGKYSAPDYELLVSEGCTLAIESTMIYHAPEVSEMLESCGIVTLVDYSSYESHPLGRVEWVKFYGALLGREDAADEAFAEQEDALKQVEALESSGKTVAFFYITENGAVNVRKSSDYVPKMIELAGGEYIFSNLGDAESKSSSMSMQMEEFYAQAKDADYIIYNGTVDGGLATVEELLAKSSLFSDFRAVENGNVWCATNDIYQQSMSIGTMIEDIHNMLSDDPQKMEDIEYLYHVE